MTRGRDGGARGEEGDGGDGSKDRKSPWAAVAALRGLVEVLEVLNVERARAEGWSWEAIATWLDVTRQAVHKKDAGRRLRLGRGSR